MLSKMLAPLVSDIVSGMLIGLVGKSVRTKRYLEDTLKDNFEDTSKILIGLARKSPRKRRYPEDTFKDTLKILSKLLPKILLKIIQRYF